MSECPTCGCDIEADELEDFAVSLVKMNGDQIWFCSTPCLFLAMFGDAMTAYSTPMDEAGHTWSRLFDQVRKDFLGGVRFG